MEPIDKPDKPPELSVRQDELLHLAGTVRLPTPYPATGSLAIVQCDPVEKTILRLTHKIGDRIDVARIFRLSDVHAIRATWPALASASYQATEPLKSSQSRRELKVVEATYEFLVDHINNHPGDPVWLEDASVFLPESAPLVLLVEAAQSAAESAEYYPPLTQSGTHSAQKYGLNFCNKEEEEE